MILFQSTHPRGVRPFKSLFDGGLSCISIHAPTRGATRKNENYNRKIIISIHAPTRGATFLYLKDLSQLHDFNPRTHEGCDFSKTNDSVILQAISIHAPTRGATRIWKTFWGGRMNFNPRTHEGCDTKISFYHSLLFIISIHAPTRGATIFSLSCL